MQKIILLAVSVIVLCAGCTVFRGPMQREAAVIARSAGMIQSPQDPQVYMTRRAALAYANGDPIMLMVMGIDSANPVELTGSQAVAFSQFCKTYNFDSSRPVIQLSEICWKEHPILWPAAVVADKAGPPTAIGLTAGGLIWGASEINGGGGGGDDKPDIEITGDTEGDITIYNNDGDVKDDHSTTTAAP